MSLYDQALTDANYAKVSRYDAFARERGHTITELAMAWLLAKPCVSTVIPGARTPAQVIANIAASQWTMTPEEISEIDAI